jgi:hypothetical protein
MRDLGSAPFRMAAARRVQKPLIAESQAAAEMAAHAVPRSGAAILSHAA